MKVYVLQEDYTLNEVYSPIIIGVYSSKELVEAAKKDLINNQKPQYKDLYYYYIEEYEVDA